MPHENIKQGRVTTIACHSHAGQGGGNHTNSQGKAGGRRDEKSKVEGLYNGLDKADQTNEEGCGGQAAAATSAGEVGQAEDRTSAGHGRYAIDRHGRGRFAGDVTIKQRGRYSEGEAWPERYGKHAQKYNELGTNLTQKCEQKCEQARLELDGVKPWSKTTTERDKFEDSEGTGTKTESATKLQVVMSLPGTHKSRPCAHPAPDGSRVPPGTQP